MSDLRRPLLTMFAVLMLSTFGELSAIAQVPNLINYQGKLTDASGTAINNPAQSMIFSIYDVSSSGTPLWAETVTVAVTSSIYNVALGSVTPFPSNLFSGTPRYLGVDPDGAGGDAEMTPRQQIGSVAYALQTPVTGGAGFPRGMQEFTSPGTSSFIVPAGVTSFLVEVWGAGGGGGGGGSACGLVCGGSGGGGGGAGAYSRAIIALTPGQTYTVRVGTGGTAGAAGGGPGGNSSNSSLETFDGAVLLLSTGGSGGQGGIACCPCPGGAGGTGGIADPNAGIKRDGANGDNGGNSTSAQFGCTAGQGRAGASVPSGTMDPVNAGKGGSGGNGASSNIGGNPTSGTAGGDGYVLIQW